LNRVRTVPLPSASAVADWYANADLADAFAIALPSEATSDILALGQAVLATPPGWVSAMLALRDVIVTPFGIKTTRAIEQELRANGVPSVGIFRILSTADTEAVVGERDSHLDFKASLLLQTDAEGRRQLVVTTVVRYNNWIGRIYLAVIAPFHRRVVRSSLRLAALRGWPPA
jgi:hypothetical protein